jgi:flagellar assembly protein FliH
LSDAPAIESAVRAWEAPELARRPPTVGELDELVRQAHEEAYTRGHEEGFQHGMTQAQGVVERVIGMVENLRKPLEQLDRETIEVLTQLACTVAGALLRERYAQDPQRLADLVSEIVADLAPQPRAIELRLHPDDAAALAPLLSSSLPGGQARVLPDALLKRGDLRVHADTVRFDATVVTRVEQRIAALLSGDAA